MLVAVDDLDRVDEPSAALLAMLAASADRAQLLMVAAAAADPGPLTPAALALFAKSALPLRLEPLAAQETHALLASVFEDAPNLLLLSNRLHQHAAGSPRSCLELAEHLVEQGLVRFERGRWVLPERLDTTTLPASHSDAIVGRIKGLEHGARELAEALALAPDVRFTRDECLLLFPGKGKAALMRSIEVLVTEQVLIAEGDCYGIAPAGWAPVLICQLEVERRAALHRRLAEVFDARTDGGFRASRHFMHAGDEQRALHTLVQYSRASSVRTATHPEAYTEVIASMPHDWWDFFCRALSLADREQTYSPREVFYLRSRLSGLAAQGDFEDWSHLVQLLDQLATWAGLSAHAELEAELDPAKRLRRALELAQQAYERTPEHERVLSPDEALRELAKGLIVAVGVVGHSGSLELARSLPSIEPLVPLSPALGSVHLLMRGVRARVGGRLAEALRCYEPLIARLSSLPGGLAHSTHLTGMWLSLQCIVGLTEATMGLERALERAAEVETNSLYRLNAEQIRLVYQLWRCQPHQADECRRRVDVLSVQSWSSERARAAHLWQVLHAQALSDDLGGVGRSIDALAVYAKRFPAWAFTCRYARAEQHRIRGELGQARRAFEALLTDRGPGEHHAWVACARGLLTVLDAMGRHLEASERGRTLLRGALAADLGFETSYIALPLAVAEAHLGEEGAATRAHEQLRQLEDLRCAGLMLGFAHEMRARVAMALGDAEGFEASANRCARAYNAGKHPTLTTKFNRLMEEGALAGVAPAGKQPSTQAKPANEDALGVMAAAQLGACEGQDEITRVALDLFLEQTAADRGHLYLVWDGEPRWAASSSAEDGQPSREPDSEAHILLIHQAISEHEGRASGILEPVSAIATADEDGSAGSGVHCTLLEADHDGEARVVAAVVMDGRNGGLLSASDGLVDAVARALAELPPQRIHDRYLIQGTLGEGGMGAIYRALDEATGRQVALKQLKRVEGGRGARRTALFQREYQSLSDLSHPRIIRVFDYGVDQGQPYYTMELLDGQDLQQLAPLPWQRACAVLRDVASSLAIVHSRGLVHRDVSARNVRCTADGRATLLDFGALTGMGVPPNTVGTPNFMPPEAAFGQPLDQRSDLFSLGALGYWLLTGRLAYRASRVRDLNDAWRTRPRSPSAANPEVPAELDALVMSMLSLTPAGRPRFAGEVIEQLTAIAGLEPIADLQAVHAYLTTPPLVGRDEVVAQMRKPVRAATNGRGSTLLLRGPARTGRSRLLVALALEAKLAGATVLRVDARNGGEAYAVAEELVRQLDVAHGSPDAPAGQGSPLDRLLIRFGDLGKCEADDVRAPLLSALRRVLLGATTGRALVLAVDDLDRIDEPSVALLGTLAAEVTDRRLLIAATLAPRADVRGLPALELFRRTAKTIDLAPLAAEETEELVRGMFGDVANVKLVADHAHRGTRGCPGLVVEFAQRLVDGGLARYDAGNWLLPAKGDLAAVPLSPEATQRARLERLPPSTLQLLRILALCPDQALTPRECEALVPEVDADTWEQRLEDLCDWQILASGPAGYRPSDRGFVELVAPPDGHEHVRAVHLQLADVFAAREHGDVLATRHLLLAGERARAVEVLSKFAPRWQYVIDRAPEAYNAMLRALPGDWLETFGRALAACRELGCPHSTRHSLLLGASLPAGFFSTNRGAVIGELCSDLKRLAGLSDYEQLDPSLPAHERRQRAVRTAQLRHDNCDEHDCVLAPGPALAVLAHTISNGLGVVAASLDYDTWELLPDVTPFAALSPALAFIRSLALGVGARIGGRNDEARQHYEEILSLLSTPDSAPVPNATSSREAITRGLGLLEASMGLDMALGRAAAIEASPRQRENALRIRMLHHLFQGESEEADALERQAEVLMVQTSPLQLIGATHLPEQLVAHVLSADLAGVRGTLADFEHQATSGQAWGVLLEYAHAEHARMRGDLDGALQKLTDVLQVARAGRHLIWASAAGALVTTLLQRGCHGEARAQGRALLADAQRAGIGYRRHFIGAPLAVAEAELGEHGSAVERAEEFLSELNALGSRGILVGFAHEARARIAIRMGDGEAFHQHATACAREYRVGKNPTLTVKHVALMEEARAAGLVVAQANAQEQEADARAVEARLSNLAPSDLAPGVLALLGELTGTGGGYLFAVDGETTRLLAGSAGRAPSASVATFLQRHLAHALAESQQITVTRDEEHAAQDPRSVVDEIDGEHFIAIALHAARDRREEVVGMALMCVRDDTFRSPSRGHLHALAQALLAIEDGIRPRAEGGD